MVIDKRLQERFRFTGWMDYEQMPEYLAVADLVVMASEREQQARVYLETQAMERVLIASDIAAARTAVEHEATGLLFPMGDVNALTCEILRAAANPGLRREIGKGARKSVAKFSIHEISIQFAHQMAAVVRKRGEG
jgi:glycosyltransferase involved in cell wall biosynthesis